MRSISLPAEPIRNILGNASFIVQVNFLIQNIIPHSPALMIYSMPMTLWIFSVALICMKKN